MTVAEVLEDPDPVCLDDVRADARAVLDPGVWDFVEGGSGTEAVLAANRAAFADIALVPRVLTGVAEADTRTRLLGSHAAMPVAVAPMAYQRLVHEDGELATALAARTAGVPFVVSTLSSHRVEDIAATGATTWFQLYCLRDRAKNHELVARAEAAGCEALMVTVDVPLMGRRLRDVRNGFTLPRHVRAANLDSGPATEAHRRFGGGSALAVHTSSAFAPGLNWRDLAELRARTSLPVVVKGILDQRDARAAVDVGADAVVVSNHGGRQLDGAVPSARALPAVAEAVGGDCEVLLDSGVRGGMDVLKALALGARGVLLGRPVLWGLAAGGERGVEQVLGLVRTELGQGMTLAGCADATAAAALRTERTGAHA
ncbi:alpha-hydroxy acid oxidase [Streptomyces sp. CA-278952]|uniref:alpha-hydroxy acid oxidase n=1 Tax=Streptomyces sp. CA-278952 TaxID=2980556 RepID=UPI002368C40B|nr:alpha-hydroxy acid oxidase [Streptomyces sp. CA-278952]WDG32589.1 alpha-hydroxy acid oxidase [Streptomyces sp. CA-278952]